MIQLACAVILGLQMGQDPIYSGPQKGEKTPPFKVLDLKGQETDPIEQWKGAPALIVFVHELTRPGMQVVRRVDEHAARRELKGVVVLLGEDVNKNERYAPILQGSVKLKAAIGVSPDGLEGPGSYGLNRAAQLTILIAKDNVVAGNWAIAQPSDTDAPAIVKAIDEMLGVKANPLEERIAALEKEVRELRALVEELRKGQGTAKEPRKLPGAAPKDPTLKEMLRPLIWKENKPEDVDAALKAIDDYATTDDLKKQAIDAFVMLRELKYGTEYAQQKIRERCEKAGK